MHTFKKAAIALSLAAAAIAIATPSLAQQTMRADRLAAAREARAQAQIDAQMQQRMRNGAYYPWQYTQAPNECLTDEGYGRYTSCSSY